MDKPSVIFNFTINVTSPQEAAEFMLQYEAQLDQMRQRAEEEARRRLEEQFGPRPKSSVGIFAASYQKYERRARQEQLGDLELTRQQYMTSWGEARKLAIKYQYGQMSRDDVRNYRILRDELLMKEDEGLGDEVLDRLDEQLRQQEA